VGIAAARRSSISSEELYLLLPQGAFASSGELESFVEYDTSLNQTLLVRDGQVTLKQSESLARGRVEQVRLSEERAEVAQSFCDRLVMACPWIRFVAISGSTAYAGSNPHDDVDFYIVTRRNRLWVTLLIAMLVARFHRIKNTGLPQLCFNRIEEEDESRDSFGLPQDPLFAREALSLRVLEGHAYYRELVESASWMEDFFPALFRQVLASPALDTLVNDLSGRAWSIVNGIVFGVLVPYLLVVGDWRNRRLVRHGNMDARFRTITKRGFFAYESLKFDVLRDAYKKVF
jgi:hypothetical protein